MGDGTKRETDASRLLAEILGGGAGGAFAGGLAGGLASGLLTSKAGRKLGKKALELGGLAAVGGLAYAAWRRHRSAQGGSDPGDPVLRAVPESAGFLPAPGDARSADSLAVTLLRAMIAAAQADGKLDGAETRAIFDRIESLSLGAADKSRLLDELMRRVDVGDLVAAASSREIAVEIYTASLLAIETDTPAEKAYLELLAARLDLPRALVEAIHAQVGSAAGAAAA
jgi:uncharacterized membrane protein YebE (DUF533 family)